MSTDEQTDLEGYGIPGPEQITEAEIERLENSESPYRQSIGESIRENWESETG